MELNKEKYNDEYSGKYTFDDLVKIIEILRSPGGCPWDREQTHESIRRNVVEEAYEMVEAIDGGNEIKIADESGDVLLQVVLHAQIAKDGGNYDITDVTDIISRKMIHRHPHVFGSASVDNSDEVLQKWDAIKRADRSQTSVADDLKGVSKYIPTLMRAQKIRKKANKAGFGHTSPKYDAKTEEQFGKLLFDLAAAAGDLGIDPDIALSEYINKFISDFEKFESENNKRNGDNYAIG